MLTLRAPSFSDDRIIQRGKWLFRSTTDEIKAGTTYTWDRLDETPTRIARDEIEQSIRQFTNFDFEVIEPDRRRAPGDSRGQPPDCRHSPRKQAGSSLERFGIEGRFAGPFCVEATDR